MVRRSAIVLAACLGLAAPASAEPVETSEVAALLAELDGRCWAVDIDGAILDAEMLAQLEGPLDLELECVIEEVKPASGAAKQVRPLPANVI